MRRKRPRDGALVQLVHPVALAMALSIAARTELSSVEPGSRPVFHVVVSLSARGDPLEARPPLACVVALDASGSMHGAPLAHAVKSVAMVSEMLAPTDALGLVAFADGASEIAALGPTTAEHGRGLRSNAARIGAGGNTNIEAALRCSEQILSRAPEAARRSILLLSDGMPNVGASTAEALRAVARSVRARAGISCLGYGPGHAEDILAAIAAGGGGRYAFVPHPLRCRRELARALGAQGDVTVDAIEVALAPADGIEIVRVIGATDMRWGREGLVVPLADMEDGAEQRVPIVVRIVSELSPRGVVLVIRVRFRCARTGRLVEHEIEITVDRRAGPPAVDPIVTEHVLCAVGADIRRAARGLADARQFAGAAAILREVLAKIDAHARAGSAIGAELGELREAILDEIVGYERHPAPEAYAALRRQTLHGAVSNLSVLAEGPLSRELGRRTAGLTRAAVLRVTSGPQLGQCFHLGDQNRIGRTPAADVLLRSPQVSQRHAEIYAVEGAYWVCDLCSTNATYVNGRRLGAEPHELVSGDGIRCGDVDLRFETT